MAEWNGEERRGNNEDHDVLTRIDVNLTNFMRRFEDHAEDDKSNFKELRGGQSKIFRYLYMGLGALGVMGAILKWYLK